MNALLPDPHPLATDDLSDRTGFDEQFLGQDVPMPALNGVQTVLLPYTHFSILMRLDERLAAVTALGLDGEKLMDLDRSGIDTHQRSLPPPMKTGGARHIAETERT